MNRIVLPCGLETFYRRAGLGKCILLLHGWGGNSDSFGPVFNLLSKYADVICPDFWGMGRSPAPPEPFGTDDYADAVKEFLDVLGVEKASVIRHSFGGRTAVSLAARTGHLIDKTVLIDSAGLKPRLTLKRRLKVLRFKLLKRLNPGSRKLAEYGSADYKKLDENMKKTFVKVVNGDQTEQAKRMRSETLIVWGAKDKDTPLWMGKKLNKLIAGSGLVVFENAGHFSYLDDFPKFAAVIKNFFGFDKSC